MCAREQYCPCIFLWATGQDCVLGTWSSSMESTAEMLPKCCSFPMTESPKHSPENCSGSASVLVSFIGFVPSSEPGTLTLSSTGKVSGTVSASISSEKAGDTLNSSHCPLPRAWYHGLDILTSGSEEPAYGCSNSRDPSCNDLEAQPGSDTVLSHQEV